MPDKPTTTAGAVVVVEDVWGAAFDDLASRRPVVYEPAAWEDRPALERLAARAAVLVVRNRTRVDRLLMEAAPALQLVARAGVGLDNIDLAAADDLGVVVSAARGANARSVAEMAVALALSVARDIPGHDRRVRGGQWERSNGVELQGRCWAAIGLGATGAETLRLAKALGMRTTGFDPYLPEGAAADVLDERAARVDDLLASADVVSLHAPLTAETEAMAGSSFFASMKPGAILVNVGRGGLVDEAALLEALDAGRLAGAALDVRAEEPPRSGPLEAHPGVVLTPHVAGLTAEAQERVASMLAEDIDRVLDGHPAVHHAGRLSRPDRPTRTGPLR
jgi:D-3-phosphoglycerate dehydrogenase